MIECIGLPRNICIFVLQNVMLKVPVVNRKGFGKKGPLECCSLLGHLALLNLVNFPPSCRGASAEGSEMPLDHHAMTSQRGYPFLLGEGGGVNYGHETLHDAKIVNDDLTQGTKQLVLQET